MRFTSIFDVLLGFWLNDYCNFRCKYFFLLLFTIVFCSALALVAQAFYSPRTPWLVPRTPP